VDVALRNAEIFGAVLSREARLICWWLVVLLYIYVRWFQSGRGEVREIGSIAAETPDSSKAVISELQALTNFSVTFTPSGSSTMRTLDLRTLLRRDSTTIAAHSLNRYSAAI
jgi:hypothetical protein